MIKALVVDDDKDFLRIVSAVLKSTGYSVTTSEDAVDALEKIEKENFDIVLSDANMPGASGFDLVKFIRNHKRLSHIAIALLTGRRDKKDVQRGLDCGADDYIVKPIDPDLFLSKVQSLLQQRSKADLPELGFAERKIRVDAKFDVHLNVISISEHGLTLLGPLSFAANHKFKMRCSIFETIGIEPPTLRVLQSTSESDISSLFKTKTSFVGLNDNELQKIRFWVNTHISQVLKAKVS